MEDVAWGILWGFGGWLVAQLTAAGRDMFRRRWLKGKVLDELMQLREELQRVALSYERAFQVIGARAIEPGSTMPIGKFIFERHYAEAAPAFSRVQRTSVQLIYASVDELNQVTRLRSEVSLRLMDREDDATLDRDLDSYERLLKRGWAALVVTQWHLHYHLDHPDFPVLELRDGPVLQDYYKHVRDANTRSEQLMKEGAKLGIEKLNNPFNPQPA